MSDDQARGAPDAASDDLRARLGGIPHERIRKHPPPGRATEQDVLDAKRHGCLCELVDGVLVEKPVGYVESRMAVALTFLLEDYLKGNNLGVVLGPDATLRILPNQIRLPDVSFISWQRFPGGKQPNVPVPDIAPDLAVEVLSPSNTVPEMDRKLVDYFAAGVQLVWYIDPDAKTACSYTGQDRCDRIDASGTLVGEPVLPGFRLGLGELFAEAFREAPGNS